MQYAESLCRNVAYQRKNETFSLDSHRLRIEKNETAARFFRAADQLAKLTSARRLSSPAQDHPDAARAEVES